MKKGAVSGKRQGAQAQLSNRKSILAKTARGILEAHHTLHQEILSKDIKLLSEEEKQSINDRLAKDRDSVNLLQSVILAPRSDFEISSEYSFCYDGISYIQTHEKDAIAAYDADPYGYNYVISSPEVFEEYCLGEYRKDSKIRRKYIDATKQLRDGKTKKIFLLTWTGTKENKKYHLQKDEPFRIRPSDEIIIRKGKYENIGQTETHEEFQILFLKKLFEGNSNLTLPEFLQAKLIAEKLYNEKSFEYKTKDQTKTLTVDFVRKFILQANIHDNSGKNNSNKISIDAQVFTLEIAPHLYFTTRRNEDDIFYIKKSELEGSIECATRVYQNLVRNGTFKGVKFNINDVEYDEKKEKITLHLERFDRKPKQNPCISIGENKEK